MEQLIYSINGKNYLLFKLVLTNKTVEKFEKEVDFFQGIVQSFEIEDSFWNGKRVKVSVLIPENKAIEFSKC